MEIEDIEKLYNKLHFIGWTETSAKDDMMVSDSVKFLVDTMLRNDVENNTASTNTEEIHLSPKAEENITSYCPC